MKRMIIKNMIHGVLFATLVTVANVKVDTPKFWALFGISIAMIINEMWQ